jgi:hypothetical protein
MRLRTRFVAAVLAFVTVLIVLIGLAAAMLTADPAQFRVQPNIVFVLVDDLDADLLEFMPTVKSLLVAQGVKYLNGYPAGVLPTHVPSGWTEWYSPVAGNPYSNFNYVMNENGKLVRYGSRPEDYLTARRTISMSNT